MVFNHAQLETLWIAAGGDPKFSDTMAAIAQAESGGDPKNVNTNTNGSTDRGLWQINDKAWGSLSTFDVVGNARAAVHVFQTQGLGAWATYNSGAHTKYLTHKNGIPLAPKERQSWLDYMAKGAPSGHENPSLIGTIASGPVSVANAIASPITSVVDFLNKISSKDFLANAGKVLLGVLLLIMGVVFIGKEFTAPVAKAVAPLAAVVK